jgi:hypothetical protein
MTKQPTLILRTDDAGALDDIVAHSVDMAHLEMLRHALRRPECRAH